MKKYKSIFYKNPIEVDNIEGEIIITITDKNSRKVIYSWYDIIAKNSQSFYINKCLLGGFIKKIPKKVLIIGFGGGAFAKYLEDHIKNIEITGIDIDEAMFEIAKKELNIKTKDFLIMEGEIAINKLVSEKKIYDLVLIDVYDENSLIPISFQSENIYKNIKKLLSKEGTLSINFANYYGKNEKIYNKIFNILENIFGNKYLKISSSKNITDNIVGVFNLDKKYSSEEINLNYLKNTKKGIILYDSNIIKKYYIF